MLQLFNWKKKATFVLKSKNNCFSKKGMKQLFFPFPSQILLCQGVSMKPVRQVTVGEGAEQGSPQHRILGAEQSKEGVCLAGLSSTEGWSLIRCWRHPTPVTVGSGRHLCVSEPSGLLEPEQGKGGRPTGMPVLAIRYGVSEPKKVRKHSCRGCPGTVSEA